MTTKLHHPTTKAVPLLLALLIFQISCGISVLWADVNVLIVGTTADKGSAYGWADSKPFDVSKVSDELRSILAGSGRGTVQVDFHDFSQNSIYGNSLIAEMYYESTSSSYLPTAADVWANLRGESGVDWDYVVLVGEPFNIERYPGLYTHGVAEMGKEIEKGGAEVVLLMPWPGSGSSATVDHYKEVVYRTGRTLGYKVAPAGLAWAAEGAVHGGAHPSATNAYLAAACLYSRIFGESAAVSSYEVDDTLANSVNQFVQTNIGAPQYTGLFTQSSDIFKMFHNPSRSHTQGGINSSTENLLKDKSAELGRLSGMDLNNGDGALPLFKGVYQNRDWSTLAAGFVMATKFPHPGNSGIPSESYFNGLMYDLSSYLNTTESQLSIHSGSRHLPHYLMYAQFDKFYPDEALIQGQHGSRYWAMLAASYIQTIFSGRCPIGPPPPEGTEDSRDYKDYIAAKIGYETAWRMSRVQGRAPGFRVLPSSYLRHAVDPETPEIMTVQFVLPPWEDVTVSISTDQPWASVSPQTLTFSSGSDATAQEVTVQLAPETASRRGETFNVIFNTSSQDEVCDGLSDSWVYEVNSLPVPVSQSIEVMAGGSITFDLSATDVDPKQEHTFQVVTQPENGTVLYTAAGYLYTPDPGFYGLDSFEFIAHDGQAFSPLSTKAKVDIAVIPSLIHDQNLLFNPSAELTPLSAKGWTGTLESVANPPEAPALTGQRVFAAPSTLTSAESYQDVDLTAYVNHINAGIQEFRLQANVDDGASDDVKVSLKFLDQNGQVIGTPYESPAANSTAWTQIDTTVLAPVGAVAVRVTLKAIRVSGGETTGWFEDISLLAVKPPNSAPVITNVPAASVAVDVPTSILVSAKDIDGDDIVINVVPGKAPLNGTIVGNDAEGMPIYRSNPGYLGSDSFTVVANDGQVDSAEVLVNITVRANEAPKITIHSPIGSGDQGQVYMTLTNGLVVDATVTDDGGPSGRGELIIAWQQTMGPNPITFGNPYSEDTTVNWGDMNPGTYRIVLRVSDGELTTTSTITIEVLSNYTSTRNIAPQIDVGGPYNAAVVNQALSLEGQDYFNDNLPNNPGYTSIEWTAVSGPGNATFSNPYTYQPLVTFDTPGEYVLRLSADDGLIKAYENLVIQVNSNPAGNTPPTANAGNDQTVPSSEGTLNWTPADMAMVSWYDAADADTVSEKYGKVSQWADKSGNGHHAVQSAFSRRPTYTAADAMANKMPSIGDLGNIGSVGLETLSMGAKNIYVVSYQMDGVNATFINGETLISGPGASGQYRITGNKQSSNFSSASAFNDAGTYKNGSTTSSLNGALPMPVSMFKFKSSERRTQVYHFGYNTSDNRFGYRGSYSEIIFTDGTEDFYTEQKIEGYLAHKWGLAGKLPSNHPYKDASPLKYSGPLAVVSLNGSAVDVDNNHLDIDWSVESTNPPGLQVSFDDSSVEDPVASFMGVGTYTLSLTVTDNKSDPVTNSVVITVTDSGSTFAEWIAAYDLDGQNGFGQDPDGDGLSNGLESYLGTDPSSSNSSGVMNAGELNKSANTFTFSHPFNPNAPSDIVAGYRWSPDLANFHGDGDSADSTTVNFVQGTPADGWVTVTATITGVLPKQFFVDIEVTQQP